MEKKSVLFLFLTLALIPVCYSQVDTTWIYNPSTPYGSLDIRIAKSATQYYYLKDGTFSYRESAPGVKTNTFFDMTAWDSSPYREGQMREKNKNEDIFIMNYRLLLPDNYKADYAEGYPIIFMLHGYGERGNCNDEDCYHADRSWNPWNNTPPAPTNPDSRLLNNDHNLLHGGSPHLAAMRKAGGKLPDDPSLDAKAFPGIVLFPQNLNGWNLFAVQDAIRLLRLVIKKYNVDEDRVYIEGLSNGAHGVFEALKRAPWLFASATAMSVIDDGFVNDQGVAHTIAHIPMWIFQGGQDINPYPSKTRRYIQQFRSVGATVRYTLYPELGHGTWNKAFTEPDFFSWMLKQNKSTIHTFEGATFICSDKGTRLELAHGFKAYQWEFNGQVIAGADSAVFYAKTPGKYRARFSRVSNPSEAQWNQWSKTLELKPTDPPVADIEQIGTVVLKDLNRTANALMRSRDEHAHYYWYKNGVLLDLPGNEDDTTRVVELTPKYGNGAYTLAVADYGCISPRSSAKHVFFDDSAPVNINAPTEFNGLSPAPDENVLSWKDASTNEDGFEIWRRRKVTNGSGSSFSPWEMAGITEANATTFDDKNVEPTVSYQYKIRAVGASGRSEYNPADANTGIEVKTVIDKEAPSAPAELKASSKGVQKIFLSWKPATDNTRIREYWVYFNGDSVSTTKTDTTFLLSDLPLNTDFKIRVKSMDLSRNLSAASNEVKASTFFSGLYYTHTTGAWTRLDSVDWDLIEFSGKVSQFTLKPKTQEDYYNFTFDGFLLITDGGKYQFRTTSSDGSRLWIDNKLVVDNDGIHEVETVEGAAVSLEPGPHRIFAQYFEDVREDSLSVEYKGADTGNEWVQVGYEVLKSDTSVITSIGNPDNGPEDSFTVSVFPNPTTQDNIRVMVETVLPAPVRVSLIDLTGSSLYEGIFQPAEIIEGIPISPRGTMSNGMYLIQVEQGGIISRQKIIVHR